GTVAGDLSKVKLDERTKVIGTTKIELIDASVGKIIEIETAGTKIAISEKEFVKIRFHVTAYADPGPTPYYSWSFFSVLPFSVKDAQGKAIPIWKPRKLTAKGSYTYIKGGVKVGGF